MKTTPRMRKVNETLKEALAEVLTEEVSDPRLTLVTVTGVECAPDLRLAVVYVTAHGDEARYARALDGLRSAAHRIRRGLAERVRMKYLPRLEFRIDPSVDEAIRIGEALKTVPPHVEDAGEEGDA